MSHVTFGQRCTEALKSAKRANPELPWEEVTKIIDHEDSKRTFTERRPQMSKSAQASVLFDALATASGVNPKAATRQMRAAIGVALADIRAVSPEVTPEEITRRVELYRSRHPMWVVTATSIAKYWGEFGDGHTRLAKVDPYIEPPHWQNAAERKFPGIDFTNRAWADISASVRRDILTAI